MTRPAIPVGAVVALLVGTGILHTCMDFVSPAQAQTFPDKPVKIIVPSAAGGPTDVPARLAQQILPPRLRQPSVSEPRPGAGGAIGARAVAPGAPDAVTLMAGNTSVLAVIPAVSMSAGY